MSMTDNSLFLMKIEHHYKFQTKLTLRIDDIIEQAATYFKRISKTALKNVTMRLISSWQRTPGPRAWAPLRRCACELVTPPYFTHWFH